jgi:uncharacterized membrane protein YhaH (DUF805 family)
MTFTDAVRTCLREKYATFSGRAPRSEYWWFYLAFLIFMVILVGVFGGIAGGLGAFDATGEMSTGGIVTMIVVGIAYLALIIPFIAVTVRRFHDYNLSGWWVLAAFLLSAVPVLGLAVGIGMIVICCLKGTQGPNKFGPDPLGAGDAEIFS